MAVKVFIEEFKGNKIFGIYEVDAAGNKSKQYPEISFGGQKAAYLFHHTDDLKKFVDEWRASLRNKK